MRILCIHGVNTSEIEDTSWQSGWANIIRNNLGKNIEVEFVNYNDIFDIRYITTTNEEYDKLKNELILELKASIPLDERFRMSSVFPILDRTAGMVSWWLFSEDIRKQARDRISQNIENINPDIICAHSLGSVITYDAFLNNQQLIEKRIFITFGSQIADPRVQRIFKQLPGFLNAKYWYNLFNPQDVVFIKDIQLKNVANFSSIKTEFSDFWNSLSHDATKYLNHQQTKILCWDKIKLP